MNINEKFEGKRLSKEQKIKLQEKLVNKKYIK